MSIVERKDYQMYHQLQSLAAELDYAVADAVTSRNSTLEELILNPDSVLPTIPTDTIIFSTRQIKLLDLPSSTESTIQADQSHPTTLQPLLEQPGMETLKKLREEMPIMPEIEMPEFKVQNTTIPQAAALKYPEAEEKGIAMNGLGCFFILLALLLTITGLTMKRNLKQRRVQEYNL